MNEDREQMLFIQWFKRHNEGILIFHIPNGGKRSPAEGAKFKAMGVVAGVPDLFIPSLSLWIEMKKEIGGIVSKEQKAVHKHLESLGHTVIIGNGYLDAIMKINLHLCK